jgi:hypothetical protein
MSEILVRSIGKSKGAERFHVEVRDDDSATEHEVTVLDDFYNELTDGGIAKEELIRRSFVFLLERESKESILNEFELSLITKYFPEYERVMKKSL